jgi:carbon-monoxide dehydrogenase catalytic subunit
MPTQPQKSHDRAWDSASVEILKKAEQECIDTCFTRMDLQQNQCKIGKDGVCCRICHMGPCRITKKSPRGVCGADADTIVARNFLREVVGGTAAHSDHGRHLVLLLKKAAEGNGGDYQIKDERALRYAARLYKLEENGHTKEELASKLADFLLDEFTKQEENSIH